MIIQFLIGIIIGIVLYNKWKERREKLREERDRRIYENGYRDAQKYEQIRSKYSSDG